MTNKELLSDLLDRIREVNDTLYYLARNNILTMSETLATLNLLKVTETNKNIVKDNLEKNLDRTVEELE
ncbi:MAG: hypothetical protein ABIJ40_12830 [Bacteroidota bacterium]